jgi:surface protein
MFSGCESLNYLDISNFDTSKVDDLSGMFYRCESLDSLDISNFDISNVQLMCNMLYNCNSLNDLYINEELEDRIKLDQKLRGTQFSDQRIIADFQHLNIHVYGNGEFVRSYPAIEYLS